MVHPNITPKKSSSVRFPSHSTSTQDFWQPQANEVLVRSAWDGYIGLGTICFGLAMLRHPRFGRVFGVSGIVIGAGLLALNLWTFPSPPVNAGLVDLGPAVGLWYLVVTIRMASSFSWVRGQAAALSAATAVQPSAYTEASATRRLDQP